MRVVWTPDAEQDRLHILDYIAERDPDAAARVDLVFAAAVANLATFPCSVMQKMSPGRGN